MNLLYMGELMGTHFGAFIFKMKNIMLKNKILLRKNRKMVTMATVIAFMWTSNFVFAAYGSSSSYAKFGAFIFKLKNVTLKNSVFV